MPFNEDYRKDDEKKGDGIWVAKKTRKSLNFKRVRKQNTSKFISLTLITAFSVFLHEKRKFSRHAMLVFVLISHNATKSKCKTINIRAERNVKADRLSLIKLDRYFPPWQFFQPESIEENNTLARKRKKAFIKPFA